MPASRGHINPGSSGVRFDGFELGDDLAGLVRHAWVPRWDIPDGEVRVQRVLTYPALNAAIAPEYSSLFGPDSRVGVKELRGTSWTVGILFRPAAAPLLTATDPVKLAGSDEPLPSAPAERVRQIMSAAEYGRAQLARALGEWLLPIAEGVDERGRLVNEVCRLAEEDPDLTRSADLAARFGMSSRSLERLVRSYTGLTPKWLIECRRLQHAATTLYGSPDTGLSALAADLGYTDYSHFFRQYQRALGESPRATRDQGRKFQSERSQ